EVVAALARLGVRRTGLARAANIHRNDEIAIPRQALVESELHAVGLLAGFVDVERGAQAPVGAIGEEGPGRDEDAGLGEEFELLDAVAFALRDAQEPGGERAAGFLEADQIGDLGGCRGRAARGRQALLLLLENGEDRLPAMRKADRAIRRAVERL